MIDKSLTFLRDEVNSHLVQKTGNSSYEVLLSPLLSQKGDPDFADNNIGLTLVNTEEEFAYKDQKSYMTLTSGDVVRVNPEIKLNLYIMFSAHFANYDVGLLYLSHIVKFFQSKRYFDHQNSPTLSPEVDFLNLELYTLNFEQINQLWGAIGAKYRPSILYKVRMLCVQEGLVRETTTEASQPNIGANPVDN